RVARRNGSTPALPDTKMTSGACATNSAAYLRVSSSLPPDHRKSIWTFSPTVHPNCCRACRNAALRFCAWGWFAPQTMRTATRRADLGLLCARAASGQAMPALPTKLMKSRRRIGLPLGEGNNLAHRQTTAVLRVTAKMSLDVRYWGSGDAWLSRRA